MGRVETQNFASKNRLKNKSIHRRKKSPPKNRQEQTPRHKKMHQKWFKKTCTKTQNFASLLEKNQKTPNYPQ
jgi:hypothetical protein